MDTEEINNNYETKDDKISLGSDFSSNLSETNYPSYGGWSGMGSSSLGSDDVSQSNIISQLSPAADIKEFAHHLKGETFNPSTGRYEKAFETMLNEKGQNFLLFIYKGVASQTLRTTFLKPKEAVGILKYYAQKLYPVLRASVDEFEIKNPEFVSPLFMMTMINLKALANKAIGGGERSFIKGTYGERGVFSSREGYGGHQEEKGGFFSKLFGR